MVSTTYEFPTGLELFATCDFYLTRVEVAHMLYDTSLKVMELGDAVWAASYQTVPLSPSDRAIWQSWALALKGSHSPFFAYDPEKRYPLNYGKDILTTFAGLATLNSATVSTLTISGLPAGHVFAVGDHVSIPMSGFNKRALFQVLEAVTANGSGVATVSVEPNVDVASVDFVPPQGVQLVRPACLMVVIPGSFIAEADYSGYRPVKFDAIQTFVGPDTGRSYTLVTSPTTSTIFAKATASGVGTAAAVTTIQNASAGHASGLGAAAATSDFPVPTGVAAGVGVALAVGRQDEATAAASGVATVSAVGAKIGAGVGSSHGQGTVTAVGRTVKGATAAASGVGTASATGTTV